MAEVARVEMIIGGAGKQNGSSMSLSMQMPASDMSDESSEGMVDDDSALPMPSMPSRQGLRAVDRQSRNTGTFGQF